MWDNSCIPTYVNKFTVSNEISQSDSLQKFLNSSTSLLENYESLERINYSSDSRPYGQALAE